MECKYACNNRKLSCHGELIDTLWNVNAYTPLRFHSVMRINRYIMECKYENVILILAQMPRINRYIMECKSHCSSFSQLIVISN